MPGSETVSLVGMKAFMRRKPPVMESRKEEPVGLRRSSKQPVPPAQPDYVLTIGSQRLPAVLADKQETGLFVLIQGSPLFWVEDSGVLETSEVEIAVRVSKIVRLETGEDEFASSLPAFRIGLTQLGQTVVKPRPQPPPIPRKKARSKLLLLLPLNRIQVSVGGLIGFVLIVTPVVFVAAAWLHHLHQAQSADSQNSTVSIPDVPQPTTTGSQRPTVPTVPAVPEPTPDILRLPGIEPFLTPVIAKKLELTPSQTGAFERLNGTVQEALEDLEKYWESGGRLELAQRRNVLLEAARQEALRLLTDQQRQRWKAMTR